MALSSSVPSIATAPTTKSGVTGLLLPEQIYAILKLDGYAGKVDIKSLNKYIESKPAAKVRVAKMAKAVKEMKKLNAGGVVSQGFHSGASVGRYGSGPHSHVGSFIVNGKYVTADEYYGAPADGSAKELEDMIIAQSKIPANLNADGTLNARAIARLPAITDGSSVQMGGEAARIGLASFSDIEANKLFGTPLEAPAQQVEQKQVAVTPSTDPDPRTEIGATGGGADPNAITASNAATTVSAASNTSANTTTGNENTMAEETAEVTAIKNLNDRLTIAKQALITAQAKPDNPDGIATAQNKVNELVGELSNLATGKQSETSLLAVADPSSLVQKQTIDTLEPDTAGTTIDAGTGQLSTADPKTTVNTVDTQVKADAPAAITAETAAVTTTKDDVDAALKDVTAVQGTVSDQAQVTAAQGE